MQLRQLHSSDLQTLVSFYSGLSESVTRTFEPFGPRVTEQVLRQHLSDADAGTHLSFGLFEDRGAVCGHVFILNIPSELPVFGIGLAEPAQGQGWGRRMAQRVMDEADARAMEKVTLTVLKTNTRAWTLYESLGFTRTGETTFRAENDSYCMERKRK
jgi:ribosomal protein S18 acetylase RimI-like enzyme